MSARPITIPILTGPTASGKSALALALAERRSGSIVNADAMQTYAGLPILTAQPGAAERARVPHLLYGVRDLAEPLTAEAWRRLATDAIASELATGRRPMLVGGSGLYLRTLTQGLAPMPQIPAAVRAAARADWQTLGPQAFRERLAAADPQIVQRLAPADRQRQVRAWEVYAASGRPLSDWQRGAASGGPAGWRFLWLVLAPDRAWLRDRIAVRFDAMQADGVLDEVRAVAARNLPPDLPGLKAHGAPELLAHLAGKLSFAVARQRAIDITRQYAKRQSTWFRHQIIADTTVDSQSSDAEMQLAQFLDNSE